MLVEVSQPSLVERFDSAVKGIQALNASVIP